MANSVYDGCKGLRQVPARTVRHPGGRGGNRHRGNRDIGDVCENIDEDEQTEIVEMEKLLVMDTLLESYAVRAALAQVLARAAQRRGEA